MAAKTLAICIFLVSLLDSADAQLNGGKGNGQNNAVSQVPRVVDPTAPFSSSFGVYSKEFTYNLFGRILRRVGRYVFRSAACLASGIGCAICNNIGLGFREFFGCNRCFVPTVANCVGLFVRSIADVLRWSALLTGAAVPTVFIFFIILNLLRELFNEHQQPAMLTKGILLALTLPLLATAEVLWNAPAYKKNIRIWDEDPRHHFPYYLGAFEIKHPYFPYSYRGRYSRERHENSLNPYEIVGFHYIPYSKLGRTLAYFGDRLVHTERKKYGSPNFIVPQDVPERRRDNQFNNNQEADYSNYQGRQDGLQKRAAADQGLQRRSGGSFKLPSFNWRKFFGKFSDGMTGDVHRLFGEAISNMFGPVFTVVFFLLILTFAIWIAASVFSILTLPIRFLFGIKAPILRRFIVRLISYYAQDMITKMQTSLPFAGTLQVPAEGLEISKPQEGENIGFTLGVPATTITYSYNLSAGSAAKLQALLDAFNEVFNVQRGSGTGGGASARSGDEDDDRFERILSIAADIKDAIGDKCEENPLAVRETSMVQLCDRANQALQLTGSMIPKEAENLHSGEKEQENPETVTQMESPGV